MKKWRKNLVELDARLAETSPGAKREATTDSINIDELLPKFMANMRQPNQEELEAIDEQLEESAGELTNQPKKQEKKQQQRNEIELLAKLKTGTDPNDKLNPFCTYSAYNEFFGFQPAQQSNNQTIPEEDDENKQDDDHLSEEYFIIILRFLSLLFICIYFFLFSFVLFNLNFIIIKDLKIPSRLWMWMLFITCLY